MTKYAIRSGTGVDTFIERGVPESVEESEEPDTTTIISIEWLLVILDTDDPWDVLNVCFKVGVKTETGDEAAIDSWFVLLILPEKRMENGLFKCWGSRKVNWYTVCTA